jgi:GAF domain-containing protein
LLEESQQRSEHIRLLQEITAAAASHVNLNMLLSQVVLTAKNGLSLDACNALVFDSAHHVASLVASTDESSDQYTSEIAGLGYALFSPLEKPIVYYEAQTNPLTEELKPYLERRGVNILVGLPIISNQETIGAIIFEIADPLRRFNRDDLRLLDQISLQVSTAVEVSRVFEETRQRADRERLVSDITARMRETLDVDTVLKTAAQEIFEALDLKEVTISLNPQFPAEIEVLNAEN